MDAERFDHLSRTVAAMTRRRSLRLLSAAILGSLLARLGVSSVGASHGCRHLGKACSRSKQCCAGARCKHGACKCKATHFKCGSECCLDGADCLTLPVPGQPKVCDFGTKQPGEVCDPAQPGQCTSGICTLGVPGGSAGMCREADCAAVQGPCPGGTKDCCEGGCHQMPTVCSGGGLRCCGNKGAPCQEDCDCCAFPDAICRKGTCCRPEFAQCTNPTQCCGSLVCNNNVCVKA